MRLENYLTDGKVIKRIEIENIKNLPMLHTKLKELSKGNNFTWTVAVVFGLAYVTAYANPSSINYNSVGDSPMGFKGFYQNGIFKEFPEKIATKYRNSAITLD